MRLATMTVSIKGFREKRGNAERIRVAEQVIEWCAEKSVDAVFFPAGYLMSGKSDEASVLDVATPVVEAARGVGVSVVVGVDLPGAEKEPKSGKTEAGNRKSNPWTAVAWSTDQTTATVWRQRTRSGEDQDSVSEAVANEVRILGTGSKSIGVLLCGEAFSILSKQALANRPHGITAVVDIAHEAGNLRMSPTLEYFAEHGLAAFMSVHSVRGDVLKQARLPGRPVRNPRQKKRHEGFGNELHVEVVAWDRKKTGWEVADLPSPEH